MAESRHGNTGTERGSIYLDANATERLRPQARGAALGALAAEANPASVHAPGRRARRLLEDAREQIAECLDASPDDVIFTSGGAEANALALHALGLGRRILVGATEHDCVLAAAGGTAPRVPVDPEGIIDLAALDRLLAAGAPASALVALMAANNETGVLHPIADAARIAVAHGAVLHVDAVQAAGRVALPRLGGGVAAIALSGHKLGGLPGAGALVLAPDARFARPLIGGAQELGRRGGTPSLPAIAAFAAAFTAAEAAREADAARLARWRTAVEDAAIASGATVIGRAVPRLGNTAALLLPGRSAATQVIALDLAGFAVSAGAACSSGTVASSHVLLAQGLGDGAGEAIRVSLSWATTEDDVRSFVDAYRALARQEVWAA